MKFENPETETSLQKTLINIRHIELDEEEFSLMTDQN